MTCNSLAYITLRYTPKLNLSHVNLVCIYLQLCVLGVVSFLLIFDIQWDQKD